MYGPRYYYGALPALLLLTARGIQRAAEWLGGEGKTAMALLVGLLIAGNLILNTPRVVEKHRGYNFISSQLSRSSHKAMRDRLGIHI